MRSLANFLMWSLGIILVAMTIFSVGMMAIASFSPDPISIEPAHDVYESTYPAKICKTEALMDGDEVIAHWITECHIVDRFK